MNSKAIIAFCIILSIFTGFLSAQSSVKGNSVNGATGIILAPTARIGWEYSDFGIDFGYSFLYNGQMDHVPAINLSILRKAEIGAAFNIHDNNDFNLLFHGKFQFYRKGGSAVAMGLNGEVASINNDGRLYLTPFLVATYSGNFFTWPAVTSMMFGWHMLQGDSGVTSNFAFAMGFELSLIPEVFNNYLFWISDFSNYSYSVSPAIDAGSRGAFNTGIRIDPVKNGKIKLVFDIVGTDLLDSSRGFMAAATIGFGF